MPSVNASRRPPPPPPPPPPHPPPPPPPPPLTVRRATSLAQRSSRGGGWAHVAGYSGGSAGSVRCCRRRFGHDGSTRRRRGCGGRVVVTRGCPLTTRCRFWTGRWSSGEATANGSGGRGLFFWGWCASGSGLTASGRKTEAGFVGTSAGRWCSWNIRDRLAGSVGDHLEAALAAQASRALWTMRARDHRDLVRGQDRGDDLPCALACKDAGVPEPGHAGR